MVTVEEAYIFNENHKTSNSEASISMGSTALFSSFNGANLSFPRYCSLSLYKTKIQRHFVGSQSPIDNTPSSTKFNEHDLGASNFV